MFELRFHGRGGRGCHAAQTIAEAAVIEGNYAVAFPFFGAERRGAPVLAFARIDSKRYTARHRSILLTVRLCLMIRFWIPLMWSRV